MRIGPQPVRRLFRHRAACGAGLILLALAGCGATPAPELPNSVPRPPPISDRPNAPAASGGPRAEVTAPAAVAWSRP